MSKRKPAHADRDFGELREWLDQQYQPGRAWRFRGPMRAANRRNVAGYALLLTGSLTLIGACGLLMSLLTGPRTPADLSVLIFLGVVGAFQLLAGTRLLGRRANRAAQRPRTPRQGQPRRPR